MSERSVGGTHWADLDGLRAWAILLVLGRHSLRPFISEDAYHSTMLKLDLLLQANEVTRHTTVLQNLAKNLNAALAAAECPLTTN